MLYDRTAWKVICDVDTIRYDITVCAVDIDQAMEIALAHVKPDEQFKVERVSESQLIDMTCTML